MARLGERMKQLFDEQETKDVTFVFNEDGKESTLHAHRVVLLSASPVFKAMFFGPLAEKGSITIIDSSATAFNLMLQYIYSDECQLSIDNVGEVMYLASKYQIDPLYKVCKTFVESNLDRKSVVKMYQIVNFLGEDELVTKCLDLMDRFAHYIINSNEIVETLDESLLVSLLKRDTFCAREIDILDAVRWWATQQVGPDSAAVRKCLANILPLIRFPLMTLKEFVSIAVPSDLLTDVEIRRLLVCYNLRGKQDAQRIPRTLKIEFSVKASELPNDQGISRTFERAASKGLRSIKFRVQNRVFLKRVDLANVPDRITIGTFVTVVRVLDLDLNESVGRHDFILKRQNPSVVRTGRYDLELSDPIELCPKIYYEIQVSVECPKNASTENVKIKLPNVCDAFFLFEKYARIFDDEVQVAELQFMY